MTVNRYEKQLLESKATQVCTAVSILPMEKPRVQAKLGHRDVKLTVEGEKWRCQLSQPHVHSTSLL